MCSSERVHSIYDLASVWKTTDDDDLPLVIEVAWVAKPSDRRNELRWGETELELALTARNTDSDRYVVRIGYDGEWGEGVDDIWNHLKLLSVEKLS